MNYKEEKQNYLRKNEFIVKVMLLYIDDFQFLFECLNIEAEDNMSSDVEDVIVHLIDIQGDEVCYTPLSIA